MGVGGGGEKRGGGTLVIIGRVRANDTPCMFYITFCSVYLIFYSLL